MLISCLEPVRDRCRGKENPSRRGTKAPRARMSTLAISNYGKKKATPKTNCTLIWNLTVYQRIIKQQKRQKMVRSRHERVRNTSNRNASWVHNWSNLKIHTISQITMKKKPQSHPKTITSYNKPRETCCRFQRRRVSSFLNLTKISGMTLRVSDFLHRQSICSIDS